MDLLLSDSFDGERCGFSKFLFQNDSMLNEIIESIWIIKKLQPINAISVLITCLNDFLKTIFQINSWTYQLDPFENETQLH